MKPLYVTLMLAFVGVLTVQAPAQEADDDPLGGLALEMEQVVIDLSGFSTDEPVQGAQKQIVTKLDKLIEELEKESEQSRGGSSGANPTRPLNDSIIKGGPGGIGDLHAARKSGKQWAELPPHERERIVQSMTEGFPAHYQKILERYYKRLAEETPAGAVSEEAADGDAPAKETDTKKNDAVKKPAQASSKPVKRSTKPAKKS